MTRQNRSHGAYISMTEKQSAALGRLARQLGISRSELLSRKLGRKFWADLDREVLRVNTNAASRSESGNDG